MLGGSFMYAMHLVVNQQVLFDMPAPTVTLYTVIAMALIVVPFYGFTANLLQLGDTLALHTAALWPLAGLTLVTFLSRLAIFFGVKRLGGMQTALLGVGELLVSVAFAHTLLGERLTLGQWIGGAILLGSILLVAFERPRPPGAFSLSWLKWIRPPSERA